MFASMNSKFLSTILVRRYASTDKVAIAKVVGCSPKWVRDVLGGRELITGAKAKEIIEAAERQLSTNK
jgi:hypothetical protein